MAGSRPGHRVLCERPGGLPRARLGPGPDLRDRPASAGPVGTRATARTRATRPPGSPCSSTPCIIRLCRWRCWRSRRPARSRRSGSSGRSRGSATSSWTGRWAMAFGPLMAFGLIARSGLAGHSRRVRRDSAPSWPRPDPERRPLPAGPSCGLAGSAYLQGAGRLAEGHGSPDARLPITIPTRTPRKRSMQPPCIRRFRGV